MLSFAPVVSLFFRVLCSAHFFCVCFAPLISFACAFVCSAHFFLLFDDRCLLSFCCSQVSRLFFLFIAHRLPSCFHVFLLLLTGCFLFFAQRLHSFSCFHVFLLLLTGCFLFFAQRLHICSLLCSQAASCSLLKGLHYFSWFRASVSSLSFLVILVRKVSFCFQRP